MLSFVVFVKLERVRKFVLQLEGDKKAIYYNLRSYSYMVLSKSKSLSLS